MQLALLVSIVVLSVAHLAGGCLLVRQRRAIDVLGRRLEHLSTALSLLTDTAEGGFRDVAQEIGRLASAPASRPGSRSAAQRRITTAARRGRSVHEIAAAEQISEGEVRLRLHLADSAQPPASRRVNSHPSTATPQGAFERTVG